MAPTFSEFVVLMSSLYDISPQYASWPWLWWYGRSLTFFPYLRHSAVHSLSVVKEFTVLMHVPYVSAYLDTEIAFHFIKSRLLLV